MAASNVCFVPIVGDSGYAVYYRVLEDRVIILALRRQKEL
jgi:hypothetical protein